MNERIYFTPNGYECTYSSQDDVCNVIVRGYVAPNGKIVERGGPQHPNDKCVAKLIINNSIISLPTPLFKCEQAIRETFEDALLDRRDLLNTPIFRNTPTDFQQKKYFAAAFDVAQKIRAKMTILDVNKLVVSVLPSAFAFVDCFARDGNGNFWLLFCTDDVQEKNLRTSIEMSIVSYIFNVGGYIPTNVSTRIGVWVLSPNAPKFIEIPNDQIAARDFVIKKLQETPF